MWCKIIALSGIDLSVYPFFIPRLCILLECIIRGVDRYRLLLTSDFFKKHYSFGFISPNVWAVAVNMIRMRIPAEKGETDTGKGELTGLFDLICDMIVDEYWRRKQTVCLIGISSVFSVSSGVFRSSRLGNPLCSPLMWSPSLGTRSRALPSAERGLEFLGMPRGLCTWVDLGFAARDFLQ